MSTLLDKIFFKNTAKNEPLDMSPETILAYNERIPEEIDISWFRKGKRIIGIIITPDFTCTIRAKSAKEFVSVINEKIYLAYNIPIRYIALDCIEKFIPDPTEYERLENQHIQATSIGYIPARE